jgi:Peptidase_C39 like family
LKTVRLADAETARRYPLTVTDKADWASGTVSITLPPLPAGTLVVPSLALVEESVTPHHWTLSADGVDWPLPEVPAPAGSKAPPNPDPRVSGEIDCWRLHAELPPATLTLKTSGSAPTRYLITVSARSQILQETALPAALAEPTARIPALSQLEAEPAIARRICSPTSLAMLIGALRARKLTRSREAELAEWHSIVSECRDAATGLYGVWPLAIGAAARRGFPGAVEVFSSWEEPLTVLARGLPFVASIRFRRDALPGAPLAETGGHLVLVAGVDRECVRVFDPAAPSAESVARDYPLGAFTAAWLRERGAAYILCP